MARCLGRVRALCSSGASVFWTLGASRAMLETALTQLRYGLSLAFGKRIRVTDLHRLIKDILATHAEFGPLEREQVDLLRGGGLSSESRRMVNDRRIKGIARMSYEGTPYYRELFDRIGLSPDDVSLDRLHDLPVTPKEDLRATPESFVSRHASPTFLALTTGTTGHPTAVWFSKYEIDLGIALGAIASLVTMGYRPEDVLQMNISSRASIAVLITLEGCQLIGTACSHVGQIEPEVSLSRLATPVHLPGKKPQVSVLTVYPSYLGALVEAGERLGYGPEDFGLERIVCGGEVLSLGLAKRAEELFGAPVSEGYLMTEIFPMGGLTCTQGHIHLTPEQGLAEVLDLHSYSPVGHGQIGTLVGTPFFPYRETTLLFRYVTGDVVRALDQDRLTCELRAMPATSQVLGKAGMSVEAGGRRWFTRDFLDLLEGERGVPLPCRYSAGPAGDGVELHVLVRKRSERLARCLEDRATEQGLPLHSIHLHEDLVTMPPAAPVRADLTELTFAGYDGHRPWGAAG
jgi:phenylacetate-coenzyme A ligase PaaK-like adenylate-forming protein